MTTKEQLLARIRKPLAECIDFQIQAAASSDYTHPRLADHPEANAEYMRIFAELRPRLEACIEGDRFEEAWELIQVDGERLEAVARAVFPERGDCLETDGMRHWFVPISGALYIMTGRLQTR